MSEPRTQVSEEEIARELRGQAGEPLLPAEKKLIAGSLVLGAALLALLVWFCQTYYPAAGH